MCYETVANFCGRDVVLQYGEGKELRKGKAEEVRRHKNGKTTLLFSFLNEEGKTEYRSLATENITVMS